jgi:outer membrane protein
MLGIAGLFAIAAPASAQGHRVAYLNSQRILQQAPGAEAVRTEIEQEIAKFDAQIQVMSDSMNQMLSEFQQRSTMLTADERTKRQQELQQKQQSFAQRAQQLEQQAAARQNELMQPIMERIERAIEDIRKEGNYAIIFDVATPNPVMVAADTTLDLTIRVIDKLKAAGSPPAARNER